MSYQISNNDPANGLAFGEIFVPPNGTVTIQTSQLATMSPDEIALVNAKIASGAVSASVTYLGYQPNGGPVTTYDPTKNPISINPLYASPLGQALIMASTASAMNAILSAGGGGAGTVTSVALTMPGMFAVGGSPITASGTLAVTLATQSANQVFAGPGTGAATAPTFRALVAADLPAATTSAAGALKQMTGIANLTDSTGGTPGAVGSTLASIPAAAASTGTDTTAATVASVNTTITAIKAALSTVVVELSALNTALKTAGIST